MERKRKRTPRNVLDSLPKSDSRTDVLPDDVRGTDLPSELPSRAPDERTPDGGVAQHPIHDDLENRDSEDYERDIDHVDETDEFEELDVALRKRR